MYIKIKENIEDSILKEILVFLEKNKIKYFSIKDGNEIKIALLYIPENFNYENFKKFGNNIEFFEITKPYKFVSREFKKEDSIIEIKGHKIGASNFMYIAGPCSVENKEMLSRIAKRAKENGAHILRGGAYKPRTSPYDFQGLGEQGLKYLREVADENNMLVVTEAMDTENLDLVCKYTDIVQIGARNMQNFSLLKKLGNIDKPILLKRGLSATINEFLMSAEYIVAHGNRNVILCERGIRTFETTTRNTLDINAIALIKQEAHLPIIVDASHGTGKRTLVEPVTLAGVIAGADGAMVEVHENPECALSDGPQSLNFEMFDRLSKKLKKTLSFREELNSL
ncbi:3-deoxy-7-phosphoheptulonate synthase [Fusobacterium russii]|uniref:3-deoxy-7-phosphoheptulonate synthase n=1 Tax=Fusobacterium russii TaxID=854 RepID=UPI00039F793D|nr:3-deoxy-7-phosphoheptulonate synthase [Fusobacterium russii]